MPSSPPATQGACRVRSRRCRLAHLARRLLVPTGSMASPAVASSSSTDRPAAGKSTLMQALQSQATFPLVVLDEPEQIGTVQPGYLIWRDRAPSLHRGYLAAIATLAHAGNHVALSAAGHPYEEIAGVFDGVAVVTVGLTCDFEVLCERERRTGRWAASPPSRPASTTAGPTTSSSTPPTARIRSNSLSSFSVRSSRRDRAITGSSRG